MWARSQVDTLPIGDAGYFLRHESKQAKTIRPVPANAKINPGIEPPLGPLGLVITSAT
jgi:hypothetical protein